MKRYTISDLGIQQNKVNYFMDFENDNLFRITYKKPTWVAEMLSPKTKKFTEWTYSNMKEGMIHFVLKEKLEKVDKAFAVMYVL